VFDIRLRLGEVIRLTARDWFRPSEGPMAVWVTGVRLVTNRPERDQWVWLEGVKMLPDGRSGDQTQILVRVSRLAADGPPR
jgi:hypothetical protein